MFYSEIKFGEVTTIPTLSQLLSSETSVYVIQEDVAREGNLIVGTQYALFTVPIENATSGHLIAGNPARNGNMTKDMSVIR